jgi:lysozyme
LLKYINNEEFDGAVKEFPKWVRSKGKILDGLISRRSCEVMLFEGNLKYEKDGEININDCRGLGAAPSVETTYDVDMGEAAK